MLTIVIQIGNSDDKLTQRDWSDFVDAVDKVLNTVPAFLVRTDPEGVFHTHFAGGSSPEKPWQNYCWVTVALYVGQGYELRKFLEERLASVAAEFNQDSIAVTYGDTQFVKARRSPPTGEDCPAVEPSAE